MFLPGWHIWCIFFLRLAACGLKISENGSDDVICSQGLSDCTMRTELSLSLRDDNSLDVQELKPYFKLCCQDTAPCALCLGIDVEVNIHLEKDVQEEDHSGQDEEDYNDETRIPKESVTICYYPVNTIPVCKRVEFTVNPSVAQRQHAKISLLITRPSGISFSSHVTVYSVKEMRRKAKEITAPSLDEVCSQMPEERVEQCRVPRLSSVINHEMNRVELQSSGSNKSLLSMCVQHEHNGRCQRWNGTTIPLYSVTPCMCFQVWNEEDQRSRRSFNCPFNNTVFLQRNVWPNVSVSVAQGQMNNFGSLLWWNLSAPCRLKGEVWPCWPQANCRGRQGLRQQLTNGTWRQDSKGQWVRIGMFEDVDAQLSPCVMVQVEGMRNVLGPFCLKNANRWRWSLLIVGLMLLVCVTVLIVYLLHDSVKKWVWSWRHGGFVKIGGKSRLVLLSPPDTDDGVSESVCKLGSLLSANGFSVSVDQWSREKQCNLGPMLWLHSQLLELKNQGGGRVVLVLTHKALERAEEWTRWHKEAVRTKGEDRGLSQLESPYSDAFVACLCLIQGEKQMGKAGERFVLVKFDSNPSNDKTLPEVFQGLLLFHLPSQTHTLLTELTVSETGRGARRRPWTGLKWSASEGFRTKNAEEAKLQNVLLC